MGTCLYQYFNYVVVMGGYKYFSDTGNFKKDVYIGLDAL